MKLDIVYATDENYAMYTAVSMCSLFENNIDIEELTVHILDNRIAHLSRERILNLASQYGRKVIFHDATLLFDELAKKIVMKSTQTITAYSCCFLSELLDDSIEKVLYLDGDSLVLGSLSTLCEMNIDDLYVCGALDTATEVVLTSMGKQRGDTYINSGLLYMNLKKIREDALMDKMITFIENVIPFSKHNDQDVVNGVLGEKAIVLPCRYNVLTSLFEKSYSELSKF